ncbi:MAG: aldo/keto reductase [Candidatus Kariarchaeaceae archaeon]|jgi:aryl-alcohol dehydrogenase-like predicted oxidoreductase
MKYAYLGQTGMKVSQICLGTMQFGWTADEELSNHIMNKAYDLGINFLDTANVYSRWSENSYPGKSEDIIGRWLKKTGNRDEIILATKVRGKMGDAHNDEGLSRRHILREARSSLKRLQSKWLDLYQTHSYDENVPIRETLEVLNDLIHQGKVNNIGTSNYPPWALVESLWVAEKYQLIPYQTLQPYYNLAKRQPFEEAKQKICQKYNIAVIPYSPLAAGFLTGKYRKNQDLPSSERAKWIKKELMTEKGFTLLEVMDEIAQAKEVTVGQISIAWLLEQPTIVAPIIGANTVEQLEEIVQATEIELRSEEITRLSDISKWKD